MIEKIKNKKKIIEGSIIGCYVNDADLIAEYPLKEDKLGEDAKFYYSLFDNLYRMGYQKFDEVSIFAFIKDNKDLLDEFNEKGGYRTLKDLSDIVDNKNIDGYIDTLNKYHLLEELHNKGFNIENDFDKFDKMSATQVFDWFEYQLNSISVDVGGDIDFASFEITEEDIKDLESGEDVGIQYNKFSHILNYLTLGIPKGNLSIVGSYVNQGKSSFVSNNMIFPIAENETKVGVIANEMEIKAYKILLLVHVLVNHLNYYKLTRKKIKIGDFSKEDREMISKARQIIKEKYVPYLYFAKTYDYDMSRLKRIIKKWSKLNVELIIYDVLKADVADDSTWKNLIESSRVLYQMASKENLAIMVVMQLALYTKQRRLLDLDVLANGKQATEPASECIFFRGLHPNEKPGQKFELKCYRYIKDGNGKYTNVKEYINLDPDKTYRVFFLSKTRNDEAGVSIVYEYQGHLNIWKELGFAEVQPD